MGRLRLNGEQGIIKMLPNIIVGVTNPQYKDISADLITFNIEFFYLIPESVT